MAPDFIKSYWNILQGHGKQSAGVSQGLHTPLDCRLILINSCHCCFIRGQQRVHLLQIHASLSLLKTVGCLWEYWDFLILIQNHSSWNIIHVQRSSFPGPCSSLRASVLCYDPLELRPVLCVSTCARGFLNVVIVHVVNTFWPYAHMHTLTYTYTHAQMCMHTHTHMCICACIQLHSV